MSRLIDADALEKAVEERPYDVMSVEWGESDGFSAFAVLNMIVDMPTIDPVKHGYWVEDDSGRLFNDHYCSICKHYALHDWLGFECLTDWCGNCGAKMDATADNL